DAVCTREGELLSVRTQLHETPRRRYTRAPRNGVAQQCPRWPIGQLVRAGWAVHNHALRVRAELQIPNEPEGNGARAREWFERRGIEDLNAVGCSPRDGLALRGHHDSQILREWARDALASRDIKRLESVFNGRADQGSSVG